MNLSSGSLGLKDLIKIEGLLLSEHDKEKIAVFALGATLNIIENFVVTEKVTLKRPKGVADIFKCPNGGCITHHEPMSTYFAVKEDHQKIYLQCFYCEKIYERDEFEEYVI